MAGAALRRRQPGIRPADGMERLAERGVESPIARHWLGHAYRIGKPHFPHEPGRQRPAPPLFQHRWEGAMAAQIRPGQFQGARGGEQQRVVPAQH